MARSLHRLNARTAASLKEPGRHSDGGGLYLSISKDGRRRWVFLYSIGSKLREMGLGSAQQVSLAEAREKAAEARKLRSDGCDPLIERQRAKSDIPTFGEAAEQFVRAMEPQFRNAKHIAQWRMTLNEYAKPLASKAVDTIATEDVLAVLRPIWLAKNETASRLRGRIERVLDAAKARGYRTGENPARWRGHLDHLLPSRQRLQRGHHPAMPIADLPAFLMGLRSREAVSARALEFLILTAARTSEVVKAKWHEFDLERKVWNVPPERMKGGRAHRVPLTEPALAVLRQMQGLRGRAGEQVFPSTKRGQPLSTGAMDALLGRMKIENATVHGFRSTFRDWVGEVSTFPGEVAEAALSHVVGDATERAYRRGDALEKRRALMSAWADYCTGVRGEIVRLPVAAA